MLAGEGTIVLDPPEGDLSDYLHSLSRLMDLDASLLYPAHGPALKDPHGILSHYIQHRLARTEQVAEEGRKRGRFAPEDLVRTRSSGAKRPLFRPSSATCSVRASRCWM